MKTIELSDWESAWWDRDARGVGYRRELVTREKRRADRLGVTVEIYHRDGTRLATLLPACGAGRAN